VEGVKSALQPRPTCSRINSVHCKYSAHHLNINPRATPFVTIYIYIYIKNKKRLNSKIKVFSLRYERKISIRKTRSKLGLPGFTHSCYVDWRNLRISHGPQFSDGGGGEATVDGGHVPRKGENQAANEATLCPHQV